MVFTVIASNQPDRSVPTKNALKAYFFSILKDISSKSYGEVYNFTFKCEKESNVDEWIPEKPVRKPAPELTDQEKLEKIQAQIKKLQAKEGELMTKVLPKNKPPPIKKPRQKKAPKSKMSVTL
jgi:hypothetical protein